MDNFMDKLAQKFNAGELIKANTQAETIENQKLKEQMQQYDNCLQEMRKLTLKNVELSEQIQQLTTESLTKVREEQQKVQAQDSQTVKEIDKQSILYTEHINELKTILGDNRKNVEALFLQADDFVHKENVKVYRNVQATMVEELKAQTEALNIQTDVIQKKINGIKPMLIITLILGAGNLAVIILYVLGILNF